MSKIVVTAFMSLDGVIESPENWSFPYWNESIERFKDDELGAAEAQLLGRRTYEIFSSAWPSRNGPYADRINGMYKYVVSSTLEHASWNNAQVIGGGAQLQAELPQLKERHPGGLLVHGSHTLVQWMIQQDMVDQYHVLVYPLTLGRGRRLFGEGAATRLELASSTKLGSGVMLLVYQRPTS